MSTRYHKPNLVSCKIVTGFTRTQLVSAYLPLPKLKYLPDLEDSLKCYREPIVLGELNINLDQVRIPHIQRVADLITDYSLVDLVRHFFQRRRFRHLKTLSQVQQETVIQSRCEYNLRTYWCCFDLVEIREMRNFL